MARWPERMPALALVMITPLVALLPTGCASDMHSSAESAMSKRNTTMTHRATGRFDVSLAPQSDDERVAGAGIGRMTIAKQFHGDLEATSSGQMLGVRTAVQGSAGYVAMERVVGTLGGRRGSFVLQHSSTMKRGTPHQSITVVPDSGTDELTGLVGTMTIDMVDGEHRYNFDHDVVGGSGG